jgi:hypothetical protein
VFRKHHHRGFDGASLYFLDDRGVLQGTLLVRRFGAPALVGVTARPMLRDWGHITRHRRQIGVPARAHSGVRGYLRGDRTIELAGMMAYARERSTRPAAAVS